MSGFLCSMVGASFTVAAAAEVLRAKKGIQALGNAQVDTAQSKFGGASALFDGTDDALQITDVSWINWNSDFTVELWIRMSQYGEQVFFDTREGSGGNGTGGYLVRDSSSVLRFYLNGTSIVSKSDPNLTTNTWYHLAITRSGNNFNMWIDGTSVSSATNSSTGTAYKFYIGRNSYSASSGNTVGHIDEFRFSNTARYTANFTAPTAAFVNDANTLFLMHANGTDASTFFEDDNGVRAQQGIIANVNAQVDTAQSKFGGSSLYVNSYSPGNGSSLYIPDIKDQVKWGTTGKSFTAECWARWTQFPNPGLAATGEGAFPLINLCRNTQGYIKWCFGVNDQGYLGTDYTLSWSSYGGKTQYDTSAALSLNTWYHIAFVWDEVADSIRIYRDGVLKLNITNPLEGYTLNWTGEGAGAAPFGVFIGAHYWGQEVHIDDLRFSDSARYTTSNFTAPTAPFVNDSNTLLLIHGDGTDASTVFRDDNGAVPFSTRTAKTITAVGNAQVDTAQYKYGSSSALFDGTGDAITIAHNGEMRFGTGDFTMEFWYRPNARSQTYPVVFSNKNGFDAGNIVFHDRHASNTTKLTVWIYNFNTGAPIFTATTTTVNGTWYHIALSRSGTSLKLFVNGTQEGSTYTTSADIDTGAGTTDYQLSSPGSSSEYNGHIDEVRISNTARYTANFTPTGPFNSDPNTMLLMHMEGTDASTTFTDDVFGVRTQKGIQALGNAQIDTAQSKFGGASALFDGTGDYLFSPSNSDFGFGTGDFTLEGWFRFVNFTNGPALFDLRSAGGTEVKPLIYCGSDGVLYYYVNGAARITGSALSATTWYHITVSRASGSTKMFVNGTQVGSTYSDSNNYGTTVVSIGIASWNTAFNALNGHADELRISNTARYTAAFTAPTAPFQNDANTLLLLHCDGTDASTVFTDDNGVTPTHSYT